MPNNSPKNDRVEFGVAGNPPNFWKSKFRRGRINAPEWLHTIGLSAYEIQCTYGVRMNEENAKLMRENAEKFGISLSIHAPYYVVLSSRDREVRERSIRRMKNAFSLAKVLGARKIVFHPGYKEQRNSHESLQRCIESLKVLEGSVENDNVFVCPETAGKISQIGSLEDVVTICKNVSIAKPCIDFGHLHAREGGSLKSQNGTKEVFEYIMDQLGFAELKYLHCHFYPVAYNRRGEKTHKAFNDVGYFPNYKRFIELVFMYKLEPTIICECKDSQDEGALLMQIYYSELCNSKKQHKPS